MAPAEPRYRALRTAWRTPERRALLAVQWPAGAEVRDIIDAMEKMPGAPVMRTHVSVWANDLGLRRPEGWRSKFMGARGHRAADPIETPEPAPAPTRPAAVEPKPAAARPEPPAAPPPLSEVFRLRTLKTSEPTVAPPPLPASKPKLPPVPRGPVLGPDAVRVASFATIRAWAGERGIAFNRADDLVRVNAKCRFLGLPSFELETTRGRPA
jgi:hypothetical protein